MPEGGRCRHRGECPGLAISGLPASALDSPSTTTCATIVRNGGEPSGGDDPRFGVRVHREVIMKMKRLLMASTATLMFLLPWGAAQAFECPKHFAKAQAAIDKVTQDMGGNMSKKMRKEDMALVHALLDDAKSRLASAKHNHAKPQGMFDHGRSIAKADAALGYANAADIFHFKLMKMKM